MADFPPGGGAGIGPSGPRATFGVRFVAALLDGVLLFIVGLVIRLLLGVVVGFAINLVAGLAYYTYLEGSPSGQTVGKRAMNIRVIDFRTGGPIGSSRALIRYLGRIVSSFVCLLGYLWMLWDNERQTWHDKIAESVVVPTTYYPVSAWPGY